MRGRRPALVLGILGLFSLLAEFLLTERHVSFVWEEWPAFYALFGFVVCSLWALTARYLWRPVVMMRESGKEPES